MKAIIYAGIGLFSVASVYGLVDYYGSQKDGSIKTLYAEDEAPAAPVKAETPTLILPIKTVEPTLPEIKPVNAKSTSSKKAKHAKKIKFDDFSRARIPEQIVLEKVKEEQPLAKEPIQIKKEADIISVSKNETTVDKKEPKMEAERLLDLDRFSRAPLKRSSKKITKTNSKKQ